ncbi:MAG: SDR family oxidoreductase [Polyangia bacterium]|jgi:NAD(P)-dependent dehydrogenase (short-subunit alcohol dehydrogenase family)|nr:SDR family oxidoreductase [Polyangia bacterium]
MKDLRDRVAVITGAASGIGRATAELFFRRGARVYGADLDQPGLDGLAAALGLPAAGGQAAGGQAAGGQAAGGQAGEWAAGPGRGRFHGGRVDVRSAEEVLAFADRVFAAEGRVDLLFNNAGVVVTGRVEDLTLEDWRRALEVNLMGVVHGVWAFVPRMVAQGGGGHLVNTASVAGLVGLPICAPYSASKFGVVGLSEALVGELAASDIRVTAICPGMVRTALLEHGDLGLPPGGRRLLERAVSLFALTPDEVAAEVLRVYEQRRSGTLALGLGSAPLWWARRLSGRGYGALAAALSRRVLGPPGGRKPWAD